MEKPKWQELCAQAAVEQDPSKLLRLVTEINQLIGDRDAKEFPKPDAEPPISFSERIKL